MSVYSEIVRLTNLRNRIRNKLINLGLMSASQRASDNDLFDCTEAIEDIGGTQSITTTQQYDVAGKQYAQVSDPNLISQNIANGVTILGVMGTHSGSTPPTPTQTKSMYLGGTTAPDVIYPDSGYMLSAVYPAMSVNPTLIPENIKSGVTIQGVTGTYGTTIDYAVSVVQVMSNREMHAFLTCNDISQLIFLDINWVSGTVYTSGKVINVRYNHYDSIYYGTGAIYLDGSSSKIERETISWVLSSNGLLTVTLPVSSTCTFAGTDSYYCVYGYTV